MAVVPSGWLLAAPRSLSFQYEEGTPGGDEGVRTHNVLVPEVAVRAYVYASFEMGPANPVRHVDGKPQGIQKVTLGQRTQDGFIPAASFGLTDDGRTKDHCYISTWVYDGQLDYQGLYARPNTPYDFKLRLDLTQKRMTVFVSGRGDDKWYLDAENVPLIDDRVTAINEVQVQQFPGAAGIRTLIVSSQRWILGKRVRAHPLAKQNRVVGPGRGFKFQPMRSTWSQPGRHVTIRRNPPRWYGFPDVCQVDESTLVCAFCDGAGHGGGGALWVRRSTDLGQTWEEPIQVYPSGLNCPRIQKLKDGSLLVLADLRNQREGETYYDNISYRSYDGGKTWTDERWHLGENPGWTGRTTGGPSRVLEMPDGSWLKAVCWMVYDWAKAIAYEPCQDEIWRSTDEGQSWQHVANVNGFPPHHMDEPSIMRLPDGRLMLVAREWRDDQLPATKAYSSDGGKTWEIHELPFHMQGRTCGALLQDGRVMVTFRSGCGRSALWAWIDDPTDTSSFRATGAHFNDRYTVGLKDGALHIDSDGVRGQCTRYYLRPPDTAQSKVDLTFDVKVVENAGRAATISVSHVGQFRLFPDRIEFANDPSVSAPVTPGEFHTYRIVRVPGRVTVYVDGQQVLKTGRVDERVTHGTKHSAYVMAFGNEPTTTHCNIFPPQIVPGITGYSIWRRFEEILDDPTTGKRHVISWSADSGEFPDQYQLDHIIEVGACAVSHDQGYSGWTEMEDGRIFVVNYTDDGAPAVRPGSGVMGCSWIRGTYLLPADLPHRGQ